jgi:hypothetical protein
MIDVAMALVGPQRQKKKEKSPIKRSAADTRLVSLGRSDRQLLASEE